MSLVGPSGSGKSSLLRAVIGLQAPLAGTVEPEVAPSEIGILFQDDALLPWKTARDNVALGLTLNAVARREALERADVWLERLGLTGLGDRFPRHLSGGQRKRVALAQVLAREPKLLLMDEPFASLDAIVRARIVRDVAELVAREGISVLLVTHDLEEAISLSDIVYLLSQGPRARITREYPVPLPRPRDPVRVRMHPAFAPLYETIWNDLSREVDRDPRGDSGTTESSSMCPLPVWANTGPDSGACAIAGATRAPSIAGPAAQERVEKKVRAAE